MGKSTLIRMLGATFDDFIELNFERDPADASLFSPRTPDRILPLLEARTGRRPRPGRTLLFLDEIQAAPDALRSLRYFREELPSLHVIAAGSLLEVALSSLELAMPVGRVEFHHLGPMQFEEFLDASGEGALRDWLAALQPGDEIPDALHEQASRAARTFLVTGGMPEVVKTWCETRSVTECDRVKQSILGTFEADFARYGGRVDHPRLTKVLRALPGRVGTRFKYAHVDRAERAKDLAAALDLLCLARVATRIPHSAANGVPLESEVNSRRFKILHLDVGLVSSALGLTLADVEAADDAVALYSGSVAEQFVGQHLLHSRDPWTEPRLHFWARERPSSTAEVDYVISEGSAVVPVEVKAGKTGRLKSLHVFAQEKGAPVALRFSTDRTSVVDVRGPGPAGGEVAFRLISLPLYLVGQARRILREA